MSDSPQNVTATIAGPPPGHLVGRRNRHPVDELADLRSEIRSLQDREKHLRDLIVADGCTLDGHEFEASVTTAASERVDTAALRKHLGEDGIRPFLKRSETVTVRVKAIDRSHLAEVEP